MHTKSGAIILKNMGLVNGFKKSSFQSDCNNVYFVLVKSAPRKGLAKKSQKLSFLVKRLWVHRGHF
jgi:hypothetical protein